MSLAANGVKHRHLLQMWFPLNSYQETWDSMFEVQYITSPAPIEHLRGELRLKFSAEFEPKIRLANDCECDQIQTLL